MEYKVGVLGLGYVGLPLAISFSKNFKTIGFDIKKSSLNPTKAPYKIYNIGNNNPVKLMDFIKAIENSLNKKFEINFMPLQPGDVPKTYANVDSLVKELNYKPNTPIQKGIDKFVNWYLQYYN